MNWTCDASKFASQNQNHNNSRLTFPIVKVSNLYAYTLYILYIYCVLLCKLYCVATKSSFIIYIRDSKDEPILRSSHAYYNKTVKGQFFKKLFSYSSKYIYFNFEMKAIFFLVDGTTFKELPLSILTEP